MISYNSSFILANKIPLPWGQNFSLIPWSSSSFTRMWEEEQNFDRCIIPQYEGNIVVIILVRGNAEDLSDSYDNARVFWDKTVLYPTK